MEKYLSRFVFALFLLFVAGAVPTLASSTTYNIDFITLDGTAPTSGSFTWNAATSTFSDFVVNWFVFTLDLTSSANGQPFSPGVSWDPCYSSATTGPEQVFVMFTSCSNDGNPLYNQTAPTWNATHFGDDGYYDFSFSTSTKIGSPLTVFGYGRIVTQPPSAGGQGFFHADAVPEPRTYLLALVGIVWLVRKQLRLC